MCKAVFPSPRRGKHQHELKLLQGLQDVFKAGDLVLADRGFNRHTLLALLWRKGVPALMRLHHARSADLRRGKRLGKDDRLVVWRKPQIGSAGEFRGNFGRAWLRSYRCEFCAIRYGVGDSQIIGRKEAQETQN